MDKYCPPKLKFIFEPAVFGGLMLFLGKHLSGYHGHTPENTVLADLMITISLIYIMDMLVEAAAKKLPNYSMHWGLNYAIKFAFAQLVIFTTIWMIWLPFERSMVLYTNSTLKSLSQGAEGCEHIACQALRITILGLQDSLFWDFTSAFVASLPLMICRRAANSLKEIQE